MKRYWKFIVPAAIVVVVLVTLMISLNSSLVYFNTPTELADVDPGDARLRLGGQVVPGTVTNTTAGVTFEVTDGREAVVVVHTGAPEQLFQEGIGVVVEGTWNGHEFRSDTMLIKHDENYDSEKYESGDTSYELQHPSGDESDQA
ncbi:MAG: cytochrome c maturation protein CcmE [Actinomycetota bacterium]|nr:cytochrome c maturation protein CcmE [Actinomycetota bacterium]